MSLHKSLFVASKLDHRVFAEQTPEMDRRVCAVCRVMGRHKRKCNTIPLKFKVHGKHSQIQRLSAHLWLVPVPCISSSCSGPTRQQYWGTLTHENEHGLTSSFGTFPQNIVGNFSVTWCIRCAFLCYESAVDWFFVFPFHRGTTLLTAGTHCPSVFAQHTQARSQIHTRERTRACTNVPAFDVEDSSKWHNNQCKTPFSELVLNHSFTNFDVCVGGNTNEDKSSNGIEILYEGNPIEIGFCPILSDFFVSKILVQTLHAHMHLALIWDMFCCVWVDRMSE